MLAFSVMLSAGDAYAGVVVPPVVTHDGVPTIDPAVALDTATKTACTPKGSAADLDTWSGMLEATVNTAPLEPKIQYVWDTFDSSVGDWGASAMGWVPDTGCAKQVRITSQITDITAARSCEVKVQSKPVTVYGNQHWTLDDGSRILVALNPNAFDLPVTYYGDDGSSTDATATVEDELPPADGSSSLSPYCIRSSSVVTVKTAGDYENNLNQFVSFACEEDDYQIVATPTGPRISYVETVRC